MLHNKCTTILYCIAYFSIIIKYDVPNTLMTDRLTNYLCKIYQSKVYNNIKSKE